MNKNKIIIVGAGLCGTLLAIRLAQRGFEVAVYEQRPDLRLEALDAGRSINLALSARGLMALEAAGLKEEILKVCIPMKGRIIHPLGKSSFTSPYSGRPQDYINSVSRPGLNKALVDVADRYENAQFYFNCKVTQIDLAEASITYTQDGENQTDQGAIVIGTDGAGSIVRRAMLGQSTRLLFDYSQDFLDTGYKELSIRAAGDGGWQIEKEGLHIWPRQEFMIIALPNLDGSFTLTMFHPFGTEVGFNALTDRQKVTEFFMKYYEDLLPYIPHYLEEYFENPTSSLGTIKCYPWQAYGKTLIMGDASHAIVPFYGQGMNASLEDVRVFDELIDTHGDNWEKLFDQFQQARKANTDAIADLAIDNFYEMRDHVDDVAFMRKRQIEMQLEKQFPDYYSKYSLVTFKPRLDYYSAMLQGRAQDAKLLALCAQDDYQERPLAQYHEILKSLANES